MKNRTKQFTLFVVLLIFAAAGSLYAQTQSANMGAPRLASPMIIPAMARDGGGGIGAASTTTAAVPATTIPVAESQTLQLPQPESTTMVHAPRQQNGPALDIGDNFNEIMAEAGRQAKSDNIKEVPSPAVSEAAARRAEMITRMRLAVEQIAAEYGNPTFAQVFTNDNVQAQILRKRVQLLHRAEAINAEITALEKQKLQIRGEVDASRRELLALQEQADALTQRLQRASVMLGMR